MGFFKSFTKILKRSVVAVATGGTSELLRAVAPKSRGLLNAYGNLLAPTTLKQGLTTGALVAAPYLGASYLSAANFQRFSSLLPSQAQRPSNRIGATPMAFNTSGFLGSLGGIIGGLGGGSNPYASGLGSALSLTSNVLTAANGRSRGRPIVPGAPMRGAPAAGAVALLGAATAKGLTKEVFLSGAKILTRLGIPFKPSPQAFSHALKRALGSIASLARRVPNGTMVSILVGLGISAGEAYLLTAWYSQKKRVRRMNPANSRALRRAARRIKSFHKLCQHTDLIKTHRRAAPSFGRKCGTCRKNPCGC